MSGNETLAGPDEMLKSALALRKGKDNLGAARLLIEALERAPDRMDLRIELVSALYAAGDISRARAESIPFETCTLDEMGWRKLVDFLVSVDDKARAQLVTLKFLWTNYNHEAATIALIQFYADGKRTRDGLARIGELLLKPKLGRETFEQICKLQLQFKDPSGAEATARRGIAVYPGAFNLYMLLARALHAREDSKAIGACLQPLTELAGENAWRWALLADAAAWANDRRRLDFAAEKLRILPNTSKLRWRVSRAYMSLRLFGPARANLADTDPAAFDGAGDLKAILTLVYDLVAAEGPDLVSCKVGAAAAKRLGELTAAKTEYSIKLRTFEAYLKQLDAATP